MKILQVGKYYHPFYGGIEKVTQNLSEGLQRRGVEVTVLCFAHSNLPCNDTVNGIRVIRVKPWLQLFSQPLTLRLSPELVRAAADCDLIHVHSLNAVAELAALKLGNEKPIISSYHHDAFKFRLALPFYRPVLRRFLNACSSIVVSSQNFLDNSNQLTSFREKCRIIPCGSPYRAWEHDPSFITELQRIRHKHGPYVLFVGRLVGYKGLPYLLKACRNIHCRLIIVGTGPEKSALKRQIERLGIESKVEMVGEIKDDRTFAAYYHGCEAFILPSISQSETFGMALLDAMAAKKPLITTHLHTGVDWVNQDKVTGLVVDPENDSALAAAINILMDDPLLRRQMGEAAYHRFSELFTVDRMVDQYRAIYSQVLAGHNPGRQSLGRVCANK